MIKDMPFFYDLTEAEMLKLSRLNDLNKRELELAKAEIERLKLQVCGLKRDIEQILMGRGREEEK